MYPHKRTKVKICCMASLEEALQAIQAGADATVRQNGNVWPDRLSDAWQNRHRRRGRIKLSSKVYIPWTTGRLRRSTLDERVGAGIDDQNEAD